MENSKTGRSKVFKLWPYFLVTFLWSIFSIWICFKEHEYYWCILLIALGFLPLLLEAFHSKSYLIEETPEQLMKRLSQSIDLRSNAETEQQPSIEFSVMEEEFSDCTTGSLIISAIIALVMVIITLISKAPQWESVAIFPIFYFIASLILYNYLSFSRSQLEKNPTMFIGATIIVTAGLWWLGHALAFINVKLTEAVFNLISKKNK